MSNTGRNKKLASFNCDEDLWVEFMHRCQDSGTTATAILTKFIELYLDGDLDNLDVEPLGKRFEERVRASMDEYLATHPLSNQVAVLSKKIAFLEGQISAYSSRNNHKSTTAKKEREFWFIQERAKYLGLKLNADQRFKIEMWVNEAYKERHGETPNRQLHRGTQAFAYPAADLDILDATIRGVVKGG